MNVLLITTDQQRADSLGIHGSALGATPNLDALARDGVTFREARCQHPYCQPSRWTLLTGQHPRRHGIWTNGIDPTNVQIEDALSTRLARAGYDTSFVGKAHFATNGVFSKSASPYMEAMANAVSMPDDWVGPYMGFDHVELVQLGHFPFGFGPAPTGLHYGRFLAREGVLQSIRNFVHASRAGRLPSSPRAPQTWHSALPESLHPTTWVADRTIDRIRSRRTRPFFLWASFPDPHHPLDPPAPWCHRFDPREVPLPRRDASELDTKPPGQKEFSEGLGFLSRALNAPGGRVSDAELGAMIAAYYGMIAQIDHAIGRILAALDAEGLRDDTLVVFTSDHGELLGDHSLLFKGPFHYDGLLKVALLMRGPGIPRGEAIDEPVGLLDVVPTLERALRVAPGPRVQGRDLAPVMRREERRDAVLTENDHRLGFREHVQTITTRSHKLNRHVGRAYGELYVRSDDPEERVNRWDELRAVRNELEERLDAMLPAWDDAQREPVGWLPA